MIETDELDPTLAGLIVLGPPIMIIYRMNIINSYHYVKNYLQLDHLQMGRLLQIDHGLRKEGLYQLVGVVLRLGKTVDRV